MSDSDSTRVFELLDPGWKGSMVQSTEAFKKVCRLEHLTSLPPLFDVLWPSVKQATTTKYEAKRSKIANRKSLAI